MTALLVQPFFLRPFFLFARLSSIAALLGLLSAQQESSPTDPPALIALDMLRIDPEARTLTLPARVNLREGILEFLLVHETGKIHESLFITACTPTTLNAALKLLGLQETDAPLLPLEEPPLPEGPIIKGSELTITVSWKDEDGEKFRVPARDFLAHRRREAPLSTTQWLYTGSYFYGDRFLAQVEGDLIAIYTAKSALINLYHPDRFNDEVWTVLSHRLPPFNHPVVLTITPLSPPES